MSAFANPNVSSFAAAVSEGLTMSPKHVAPRHLYDDIGMGLFETIIKLPEYGVAQAEERVLRRHSRDLVQALEPVSLFAELGAHAHRSTAFLLGSLAAMQSGVQYRIPDLLSQRRRLARLPETCYSDWLEEAWSASSARPDHRPMLLVLPGGVIGNLDRGLLGTFMERLRDILQPGDYFLFSADLAKDPAKSLSAYDDPAGVVSALNKNLLSRINRELGGHFNLALFQHKARWNAFARRVELHLVATRDHEVYVAGLGQRFQFRNGETIWTDSAYKFSELELEKLPSSTGFHLVKTWLDIEWALAEVLWRA